jgi:PPP family 3-phenylpropionic acid transporter
MLHVGALGMRTWVVGASVAVAVSSEVAVMRFFPRFRAVATPRNLLFLSFVGGSLRWLVMAYAHGQTAIIAVSVLHGMTFGAFFMSAVSVLEQRVPESMRATGQALFFAVAFGLSGVVAGPTNGRLWDLHGGPAVFMLAACLDLGAAGVAMAMRREAESSPALSTSGVV